MITNNNSWSLGATPNKNLDSFAVLIRSHSASGLIARFQLMLLTYCLRHSLPESFPLEPLCQTSVRSVYLFSSLLQPAGLSAFTKCSIHQNKKNLTR